MDYEVKFFQFKNPGDSIEGTIIKFFVAETGAIMEIKNETGSFLIGLSNLGLKRLIKTALEKDQIRINKTVINITFDGLENKFKHYSISGYTDPGNRTSIFSANTKNQSLTEKEFLNEL